MYPYIHIFNISIPSYGICLALALVVTTLGSILRAKKEGIRSEDILIVASLTLGSAICGAKSLYIIVSFSMKEVVEYILSGDFSFIFGNGLVFLGGLLGGLLGATIGARLAGTRLFVMEKAIVPLLPLGYAIGRVGCLLAGCCYGIEYDGFGAIHYKQSILGLPVNISYFPIQLVEAGISVCLMIWLLSMSKKKFPKYGLLIEYLMLYSIIRFILEYFRGDDYRGIYISLSTSQWICMGFFIICILLKVYWKKRNSIRGV